MKQMLHFFLIVALAACSKKTSTPDPPITPTPPVTPSALPVYFGKDTLGDWSAVSSFDASTYKLRSVSFPTKTSGYVTNNYYDNVVKLLGTTNAGTSWSAPAPFGSISRIQFLTPSVGWAYRPDQPGWNLNQTVNNGATWYISYQSSFVYTLVRNICFINDTMAYALTQQGELLRIKNPSTASSTVTNTRVDIGQNVRDVAFANLKNGWCTTQNDGLGSGGRILATADSGKTWSQQLAIADEQLSSVVFADANNGWVSTGDNFIYRTSNGGQSWSKIVITKADNSRVMTGKMIFISAQKGFMISTNEILQTSDGGLTWHRSLKDGSQYINDFCFTKPDMLWAISDTRLFSVTIK